MAEKTEQQKQLDELAALEKTYAGPAVTDYGLIGPDIIHRDKTAQLKEAESKMSPDEYVSYQRQRTKMYEKARGR